MPRDDIGLNARWALKGFDEGRGEREGAHLPGYRTDGWMDAVVPGEAHLDLMRAGKLADPFVGLNYLDCKWMEEKEWWYRREFLVPEKHAGKRVELQFGGLDTFATIWVNGKLAGKHRNMFIPCAFDVTDLLNYGHRNTVAVRFGSPLKAVEGKSADGLSAAFETHERLHARKAQMSYGWDIAPRIVTTGIWRPVYLVARGDVSIENVSVRTQIRDANKAVVEIETIFRSNSRNAKFAVLEVAASNGRDRFEKAVPVRIRRNAETITTTYLDIENPRLWRPWNIGRPELYQLSVKVLVNGKAEEEYQTRFGIRDIEVVQEPQEDGGRSFIFAVNGEKVFAKGTNWIPGDAIFARMTRKKYRELVALALANGINMFRIWGGGIYEDPYFYRLCDERGIMVWQDFMFSCGDYPEDEEFLAEVKREAEMVVTGLRNHPSVVLWCGDNEIDAGRHWSGKSVLPNKINRELLPEVCARLDPTRLYICSSPFSPDDPNPMSRMEGDNHIWHHGKSYKDPVYAQDASRFVSEIGHLALPWPESIRRFIPNEHLWPPENKAWDFHFGTVERAETRRRERVDEAIANFGFERPEKLEDYAHLSQLIQALAYKEWIEHNRRRKFLSGGILYWNLYDNWPQFSDAVVDYYQNPKIAYYCVSRAFSNLLISLEDLGDGMIGVWLINDELKDRSGKLLLRCQRLDGGTAWMRILPVKVPANSSRMVWEMSPPSPLLAEPNACFVQAQLIIGGHVVSENFHFPSEFKDIQWPKTSLSADIKHVSRSRDGFQADIAVSSRLYGRLVRIETPGIQSKFSDNFFDIPPGNSRTVRIMSDEPSQVRVSAMNARRSVKLGIIKPD